MSEKLHPQTISVIKTRASLLDLKIHEGDVKKADLSGADFAGIFLQYPDTEGEIHDYANLVKYAHENGVNNSILHIKSGK